MNRKKTDILAILSIAALAALLPSCTTFQSGNVSTTSANFDKSVAVSEIAVTVTNELGAEASDPNTMDTLESLLLTNTVPYDTASEGYKLSIRVISKKVSKGLDTYYIQSAVLTLSKGGVPAVRTVLLKESDISIDSSILQFDIYSKLIDAVRSEYGQK